MRRRKIPNPTLAQKSETAIIGGMDERPSVAYIDLGNLIHNFKEIKKRVRNSEVLCVVKANAYGHGMIEVAKALSKAGARWFGVATAGEAESLLKNKIKGKILILNGVFPGEEGFIIEHNLRGVLFDREGVERMNEAGKRMGKRALVHIKIDTGMGRLGFLSEDFKDIMEKIKNYKFIKVEGVMSHFAHADLKDMEFIKYQLNLFKRCIRITGFNGLKHIANSAGTILLPSSHLDMVRCGIAIYGVYPSDDCKSKISLKPVLSLKTKIHSIKNLPEGYGIGYGHTYVLKRKSRIAIIPLGYGDGLLRANSNRGYVLVKGKLCPIIGTVCMDLTAIDVTDVPEAKVGDEVVIIGEENGRVISAKDLAIYSSTIPYEVLCLLTKRLKRIYKGG